MKTQQGISPPDQATPPEVSSHGVPVLEEEQETPHLVWVGIGASAGGLEALEQFFENVPAASGCVFFVVVHLGADQVSILPELIRRRAAIPVEAMADGQRVEGDRVYVVPPGFDVELRDGVLHLSPRDRLRVPHHPIDTFLISLAGEQGEHSRGVILSGTGTDGTLGAQAIRDHGGRVLAQDEQDARQPGMPGSVVAAGLADTIAAATDLPAHLLTAGAKAEVDPQDLAHAPPAEALEEVLSLLRDHVGHDFSLYKKSTIQRRLERQVNRLKVASWDQYLDRLRASPVLVRELFQELLIGVTGFFRDPEAFATLKRVALGDLLRRAGEGQAVRVWVPGCSTGEEVYSLAILLRETLSEIGRSNPLQIFGTDIDSRAIERARAGFYPAEIESEVAEERLRRYFTPEDRGYRIRRDLREMVVFSVQDVLRDPPISRLDLLSCRNVLIYLEAAAQRQLLPLFHYTLRPGGVLFLGSSETVGTHTDLFRPLSSRWKIFAAQELPNALRSLVHFPTGRVPPTSVEELGATVRRSREVETDLGEIAREAALAAPGSCCVLTDDRGKVLYIQGRTGHFLEPAAGMPTTDLQTLAREGLRLEVAAAIRGAADSHQPVRRSAVPLRVEDRTLWVEVAVNPVPRPGRPLLAVLFRGIHAPALALPEPGAEIEGSDTARRMGELDRELQHNRESHQITIEELETSTEELRSLNEELQSANEELQSSNEELESSKEELQSLNEELTTVNNELQSKINELAEVHDDLENLLGNTEVAMLQLDGELRLRRYTPQLCEIVHLIDSDIGRPLRHTVHELDAVDLVALAQQVLHTVVDHRAEVRTHDGRWYLMRIHPYRKVDGRIDGVVITFVDISELDRQRRRAEESPGGTQP